MFFGTNIKVKDMVFHSSERVIANKLGTMQINSEQQKHPNFTMSSTIDPQAAVNMSDDLYASEDEEN